MATVNAAALRREFEVVERRVDAEVQECPACRARTKGRFPDGMPGPLQYGPGLQAFTVNLLIAQMLSMNRAVALVHATCGLKLSEATCLGYARRCTPTRPVSGSTEGHSGSTSSPTGP